MQNDSKMRFKKYKKFVNIILIATLFLSIGYAQLTATDLQIAGTASVYEQEGVYVSNVNYSSSVNADVSSSETKQRVGATVTSKVFLGNTQNSSITYQVTVTNSTTKKYIYIGPSVSENFYSNDNIEYSVSGINVGDTIDPNQTRTFNLTYSYKSNAYIPAETSELDAYINFGFREYLDITYSYINGSGYPDHVIKYKSTDAQPNVLNVDFGANAPTEMTIRGVDTGTIYTLGTDYTYQNGVLNFPNVPESLTVYGPVPNDPPVITSVAEEMQDTQGSIKVTFAATDDHEVDYIEIETYQVQSGVETLLSTDTVDGDETEFIKEDLADGNYYFKVRAVDIFGLTAEATTTSKEYRWNLSVVINITNGGPNGTTAIMYGDSYSTTITANNNYSRPDAVTVTMGGTTLTAGTDYSYTQNSGAFSISRVTGDISITGSATSNTCLIEGTKVKLANGREKKIEDIGYNDLLLVWSYEKGRVVEEYPLWIEKGKQADHYTRITFSDSSTINIFHDHAFFSSDENKFINVLDTNSFHVGTHILKLSKTNELKEVTVEKIEEIEEEKNYYFVASTRYYNIISDDFITTDAYTDITNLYPFNDQIKWDENREVPVLDYEYLKDFLPYYLYKGFRAGEVAILLNNNKTDLEQFKTYITDIVLADYMILKPEEKNGSRYWAVSVEGKWNPTTKYVKEGSTYRLPMGEKVKYWYSTSENKYYKPGDKVQVWTGMYFEKVK